MQIDQQFKQQLARELCAIIDGWTLNEAVARMGIRPSRVSELRHAKLERFSIAHLLRLIASLNYDIEVAIRPTKRPIITRQGPIVTVVRYDQFDRPLRHGLNPAATCAADTLPNTR